MGVIEIFLIGVGLSMDAFAVSICKGLSMKRVNYAHGVIIALFFGAFQAIMPFAGWALGSQFEQFITPVDHWIAFVLLAIIGGKMLFDSWKDWQEGKSVRASAIDATSTNVSTSVPNATSINVSTSVPNATSTNVSTSVPNATSTNEKLDIKELFMLAIATSIDALAVGISFAFLQVNIFFAIALIGTTTFVLSLIGVVAGNQLGQRFERASSIVGGIVLIGIGLKILLEHLGII